MTYVTAKIPIEFETIVMPDGKKTYLVTCPLLCKNISAHVLTKADGMKQIKSKVDEHFGRK